MVTRHEQISFYQQENREAQLEVMRKGRANLPRPKDTQPEFEERAEKAFKKQVFKLIYGGKSFRLINGSGS